jgi:hypothetical protein
MNTLLWPLDYEPVDKRPQKFPGETERLDPGKRLDIDDGRRREPENLISSDDKALTFAIQQTATSTTAVPGPLTSSRSTQGFLALTRS